MVGARLRSGGMIGGLLAAAAIGATPAAAHTGASVVYVCAKNATGELRLVSKATKCRHGEQKLSWNVTGPSGKRGARGTPGEPGAAGEKGEAGVKGEAGPPATTMWAVVEASGKLVRGGSATASAERLGESSEYEVVFNRDVSECAYIATVGVSSEAGPPVGFAVVAPRAGDRDAVFVETLNQKGLRTEEPFHLAVFC